MRFTVPPRSDELPQKGRYVTDAPRWFRRFTKKKGPKGGN